MSRAPLIDQLFADAPLPESVLGQGWRDPAAAAAIAELRADRPAVAAAHLEPLLRPDAPRPAPRLLLLWAAALDADGNRAEATDLLQRLAAHGRTPTQVALWCWSALRAWGAQPPSAIANEVQGVVVELGFEDGIDALIGHGDGTAWFLARDGTVAEGTPADPEVRDAVQTLLDRAQRVWGRVPARDTDRRERPLLPGHSRTSLLTLAGLRQATEDRELAAAGRTALASVLVAADAVRAALVDVPAAAGTRGN